MIINTVQKGRCVFADKPYKKWEIIEVCEYIVIPQDQIKMLKDTTINDYWFWSRGEDWDALILLGNGSIYNHSNDPNMIPVMDHKKNIGFEAIKDIEAGDELVFNYWYQPHFWVVWNLKVIWVKREGENTISYLNKCQP